MPFEAATLCFRPYTNSTEQHLRNPIPNANNPHLWKTIPCSRSKQKHTLVTRSRDGQPTEVMRFNLKDWLITCSIPTSLHCLKNPKHPNVTQHTRFLSVRKWPATSTFLWQSSSATLPAKIFCMNRDCSLSAVGFWPWSSHSSLLWFPASLPWPGTELQVCFY